MSARELPVFGDQAGEPALEWERPGVGASPRIVPSSVPGAGDALEGRFEELHGLSIGSIGAHLDFLDAQIDALSQAIEAKLAPFASGAVSSNASDTTSR
ncbi:MAG: hypothetical protein MSC31_14915 [Solirubrobacteraceae bacterium MAG38_C4-C5]|nr:hypothetical protein [Candidatus Siliceabacter maunaloa]